jgi:hypothetical protein
MTVATSAASVLTRASAIQRTWAVLATTHRHTRGSIFSALAERRFEDAANLFGGSYDVYESWGVPTSPDAHPMAWQNICEIQFCLAVWDILDARQVAADEYEFLIGFVTENRIRFDYSICCGNLQKAPPITWFFYSVKVNKINGQFLVMAGPAITS